LFSCARRLLLDPEVRPELGGGANALMGSLPAGALAACMDLFLLSAGPGLRGKLSHGEAVLLPAHTVLLPSRPGETPSTILTRILSRQQPLSSVVLSHPVMSALSLASLPFGWIAEHDTDIPTVHDMLTRSSFVGFLQARRSASRRPR
jgi:hypothetical protein